jgi:uncharacterized protein (TIGR02284 family)
METTEMTSTILNDLIEINNDRINGYTTAMKELKEEDADLKSVFADRIKESHENKMALATEVAALGDDIETGTTGTGKLYRLWMDLKVMFTGHSRKSVLENCEFGEDAAQRVYRAAMREDELPRSVSAIVFEQQQKLKRSHDQIKALRDAQTG